MSLLNKYEYYVRMVSELAELLRIPPHHDPVGLIRRQLDERETTFLETVRRGVFEQPANPYGEMFRLAGCTFEDLAREIHRNGLEPTLAALHRQGVYLSHDEFKGKAPIVRSGKHIPGDASSFVNPLLSGGLETRSGASRSKGTSSRTTVAKSMQNEAYTALTVLEFGLADRAQVHLRPILPAGDGILNCLMYTRLGCHVDRWFTPTGRSRGSAHYRVATNCFVAVSWLFGRRFPFPRRLPPNDFSPVAAWIARRREAGVSCMLGSYVSQAARVAAAAIDLGLDIRDTLFFVSGEALTDAKRRVIESAGVQVFSRYWINEVGPIGFGCRQMTTGNCVHLFSDSVAAVSYKRPTPFTNLEVDSLLFTNLLPSASFLFINAEMEDSGVVEPARCDCVFSAAGLTRQVRGIYSYGKLTGHGVTLLGTDIVRILEEALPERFGGAAADYQLVEHEGTVQTQLTLRVSPRVSSFSAPEVRDFFLNELRNCQGGMSASWVLGNSEALQVVCADPLPTSTGKVLSLHLLKPGEETPDAP